MIKEPAPPPPGYARVRVGGAEAVALHAVLSTVREILAATTLYDHARAHPARREGTGRAPVYFIPMKGAGSVVVRHSWHGGSLARVTGDRFIAPTRAPYELAMSLRLRELRVPTPRVVGYAIYPAGAMLWRSDVVTREIADSADLAASLGGAASGAVARDVALHAALELLAAMARAGVRHPDLNLKNILIAPGMKRSATAYLLDVDRVRIDTARARAAAANAARVTRSARKWRDRHGAPITDADLSALESAALGSGA